MANATVAVTLEGATLVALGGRVLPVVPRIYNLTGKVRQFGGAILCFVGPPWKSIDWRIIEGHGTLTPYATFTDALGRCTCRFDSSGIVERVVVGAAYVPED